MKVIAVICRKGGVGKTTISTHAAVAAGNLGLVTAVLDLDPQASSTVWADSRENPEPAVIAAQPSRLPLFLKQAREQEADLLILDTPPNADTAATEAAMCSDFLLIPCRPSDLDLKALPATIRLAKSAGKPFAIVLNAAPIQGAEVAEARAALESAGIEVAPIVLHQRKAFSSRMQQGQTAEEFEPDGKAAAEIRALVLWLCERVGLLSTQQARSRETA